MAKLVRGVIWSLIVFLTFMQSTAFGYNFANFGGRLGRPGVDTAPAGMDFQWSWARGVAGGTLTWFLDRGVLGLAQCNAACFAALKTDIPVQLGKWGLWIDLSFAEAANVGVADVRIVFSNVPPTADARKTANVGITLTKAEIRINPGYSDAGNPQSFSFAFLHEWGHILGLGDLYLTPHGANTFQAEDFCDHGLPSGPLPDARTKGDNVMQAFGVTVLDNDEIYGAEWLWGNSGSNAITTGELAVRAAGDNQNQAAAHHGLTQTPETWTYRGTVADFVAAPKVTVFFSGIQAARDVGPGAWTPTIFANRVEWDHAGAYQGNFKFEIDCDQSPERYGNATVAGTASTDFSATPAGGGRQTFPFAQIFGADCGPDLSVTKIDSSDPVVVGDSFTYTITVTNNDSSLDATNVVLTDTLPAGVSLVATTGCAEDPNGTPTCTLGTLIAGASAVVTMTVDADTDGLATNSASVSANETDPNPANDTANEDTLLIDEASTWFFSGTAQGGTIDFMVNGVSLQVITTAGQTAAQVAAAIAAAINNDPTLTAAEVGAVADGGSVITNGVVTDTVINDAGLTHGVVPALSTPGVLLFLLLMTGALWVSWHHRGRRKKG